MSLQLSTNMSVVIKLCEVGRKIRQQNKLKMRQPLKKAFVYISDMFVKHSFSEYFINELKEELNIKDIELLKEPKWYFDIDVKPNFKTLGKKLGKNMKLFQEFLKDNKEQILFEYGQKSNFIFSVNGKEEYTINPTEDLNVLIINPANGLLMESINVDNFSAALLMDITLSKELELECISNDLRRLIQDIRKNMNLKLDDRINVYIYSDNGDIITSIKEYNKRLKDITLCDNLFIESDSTDKKEYELNEEDKIYMTLEVV